jgi:hypothetical protein
VTLERRSAREIAALRQLRRALRELDDELVASEEEHPERPKGRTVDATRRAQPFT